MRGATLHGHEQRVGVVISIHAPHAGRDTIHCMAGQLSVISIHAPHAGRDEVGISTE